MNALLNKEVDLLLGDATKARDKLGWKSNVTIQQLAEMMARSDYDDCRPCELLPDLWTDFRPV